MDWRPVHGRPWTGRQSIPGPQTRPFPFSLFTGDKLVTNKPNMYVYWSVGRNQIMYLEKNPMLMERTHSYVVNLHT